MKAHIITHSNGGGGAGRATQRLFEALDESGVEVSMFADFKHGNDARVSTHDSLLGRISRRARITLEELPALVAGHPNPELFSPGMCSAISARRINKLDADVINLHWTGYGTASIATIGKINKPIVWTMHDMWPFTGGLGYDLDTIDARWRSDYTLSHAHSSSKHWDVEQWVARRKAKHWDQPKNLVAPSNWLAQLAQESYLLSDWAISVIPNPLDTQRFLSVNQELARTRFSLPPASKIILIALGGDLDDPRKGFDLLQHSLGLLNGRNDLVLAVVGPNEPPQGFPRTPIETRWLGRLNDEDMVLAYNAADVVVLPSRQDNLPQTGTEPQACGTPVVAFNIGGIPDVVAHRETGFLAQPEDVKELALGINWVLGELASNPAMKIATRNRAVGLWSMDVIGNRYRALFESVTKKSPR